MRLIDADAIPWRPDEDMVLHVTATDIRRMPTIDPVHAAGGWISVTDRPPVVPEAQLSQYAIDNGEGFLACFCDGYIDICTFWAREQRFDAEGVTHWMPLPEPPKEDA